MVIRGGGAAQHNLLSGSRWRLEPGSAAPPEGVLSGNTPVASRRPGVASASALSPGATAPAHLLPVESAPRGIQWVPDGARLIIVRVRVLIACMRGSTAHFAPGPCGARDLRHARVSALAEGRRCRGQPLLEFMVASSVTTCRSPLLTVTHARARHRACQPRSVARGLPKLLSYCRVTAPHCCPLYDYYRVRVLVRITVIPLP